MSFILTTVERFFFRMRLKIIFKPHNKKEKIQPLYSILNIIIFLYLHMYVNTYIQICMYICLPTTLQSVQCLQHQHFDIYAGINRCPVAALFTNARWTCPKPHTINASNIIIVTIKTSKSLTKSLASTPTLPSSAIATAKKAEM